MDGSLFGVTGGSRSHKDEAGFTLAEVTIVIVIMGILFGIASSTWSGVVNGRQVDSATNQVLADIRLAHTTAANRLVPWRITFDSGTSTYQVGPSSGSLKTEILPDEVTISTAMTSIEFDPMGQTTVSPNTVPDIEAGNKITVQKDGASHDIVIVRATSRVKIDDD